MSKKIFSEEQIRFMVDNYKVMPYADIAKTLGFTERQVRGKLNGMKLKKLRTFNDEYFRDIDSPAKAYWLGFIYADGWVVYDTEHRNYEMSIELNRDDEYILHNLQEELGGTHKIIAKENHRSFNGYTYDTKSSILRVYSKTIVSDLIVHGVVCNKTKSDIFPKCNIYFRDFVRGYLDGDGSVLFNNIHNPKYNLCKFTSSNRLFLEYLSIKIKDECQAFSKLYKESDYKYNLVYGVRSEAKKVLDWIYYSDDVPMLKRKYDRYLLINGLAA